MKMWWNHMEHIMNIQFQKNSNPNISISQKWELDLGVPRMLPFDPHTFPLHVFTLMLSSYLKFQKSLASIF
jgi:hypothetical protein